MPLYEFECPHCRARFEELVRGAASLADVRCPTCGSDEVRRQVSAAAVGAGGGGWGGAQAGGGSASSRGACSGSGFT
jgi:putative FmdB family regulatory protein